MVPAADWRQFQSNQESIKSKKTHDSDWLKDLEAQSWQAELVISGLLITGLFQLPDVFIKWVEPKIIQSGEIEREKEHMNFKEHTLMERFKMNSAQREALKNERLESYKRFNRIYINGTEYPNLEYHFYQHPQAAKNGVLVYIPSQEFAKGRNVLEIRKNYFSKDSIQKAIKIPFFFHK